MRLSSVNAVVNDAHKAKVFGDYFSSVFFTIEPDSGIDDLAPLEMFTISITEESVLINSLKADKSLGPDNLHPKVLCKI